MGPERVRIEYRTEWVQRGSQRLWRNFTSLSEIESRLLDTTMTELSLALQYAHKFNNTCTVRIT